jgi:hypothetical protein
MSASASAAVIRAKASAPARLSNGSAGPFDVRASEHDPEGGMSMRKRNTLVPYSLDRHDDPCQQCHKCGPGNRPPQKLGFDAHPSPAWKLESLKI